MMRRAEGTPPADTPSGKIAGEAPDHAHLKHLGWLKRREERGEPLRQHRLACARRPDHQEVMPAGGGHFERALGSLLALDVAQIGHRFIPWVGRRQRTFQRLQAFEVINELKQIARREDRHAAAAQASSAPESRGQISHLPSAFAPMAAGSAPAMAAIEPSRASSPSTQ